MLIILSQDVIIVPLISSLVYLLYTACSYRIPFCLSRMYTVCGSAVRLQEFLLSHISLPINRHRNAELCIPLRILISHHFQMTPTYSWVFLLAVVVGRAASVRRPLVVDACALLCNPGAETESERERDPVLFPRYPKVNCRLRSHEDEDQAWIIMSHCLKLCNQDLTVSSEVNCFALRSSIQASLGCFCEALTPMSPNIMRLHESWRLDYLVKELGQYMVQEILHSPLDALIICDIHQELFKGQLFTEGGKLVTACKKENATASAQTRGKLEATEEAEEPEKEEQLEKHEQPEEETQPPAWETPFTHLMIEDPDEDIEEMIMKDWEPATMTSKLEENKKLEEEKALQDKIRDAEREKEQNEIDEENIMRIEKVLAACKRCTIDDVSSLCIRCRELRQGPVVNENDNEKKRRK